MVIKASASSEIRQLVSALGAADDVAREAAVARLAVIGERAVAGLIGAYRVSTDRSTKLAILRALEPSADGRGLGLARDALGLGGDLGIAGAALLRRLLNSPDERVSAGALDALLGAATDAAAGHRLRLEAAEALRGVPDVGEQVAAAMATLDGAGRDSRWEQAALEAAWQDAMQGRLPDRPDVLTEALRAHGGAAAAVSLQALIERIRVEKEGTAEERQHAAWRTVRGAAHQALALKGSRLAAYDLRESVEAARDPLPATFLAALHAIGDESCLEPIAAAAGRATDPRWRTQLRQAFQAIVKRERISRRHAVMKRIAARWPDAARDLLGPATSRGSRAAQTP